MIGLLGAVVVAVLVGAVPARATTEPEQSGAPERRPAMADFEGRQLDLSQDWGEARACLVWRQGGVLQCFRTPEALDAATAHLRPLGGGPSPEGSDDGPLAMSAGGCGSGLRLFDYTYYGGRQLTFWDRWYWQNLSDYGFDNRTSSYAVGGCYAHLAEGPWGGGWWYPGPTYPYAGEAVMSSEWQNRVSSIYID